MDSLSGEWKSPVEYEPDKMHPTDRDERCHSLDPAEEVGGGTDVGMAAELPKKWEEEPT